MKLPKHKKQQLIGRIVAKTYKLFGKDIWEKIPNIKDRLKFYQELISIKESRNGVAFCNAELRKILEEKFSTKKNNPNALDIEDQSLHTITAR